jgi:hypothetical protein
MVKSLGGYREENYWKGSWNQKKNWEKLSSGKQNRRLLYEVAEKVTFETKINVKDPGPTFADYKLAIFQCWELMIEHLLKSIGRISINHF